MRSATFHHGHGYLWAETDRHGRVIIQCGNISTVARFEMIEDALFDLSQKTRTPVRVLRACMIRQSAPWPRRLLAGIMAILFTKGTRNAG